MVFTLMVPINTYQHLRGGNLLVLSISLSVVGSNKTLLVTMIHFGAGLQISLLSQAALLRA
jgi:hypothetical protein